MQFINMAETYSSKTEAIKLIAVILLFLVILGGFLLYVSFPLLSSKTAILDTRPIDPFDPIRGQYMTVFYQINMIPLIKGAETGDTVYVVLEEDENGTARYQNALLIKPDTYLFIKGNIQSINNQSNTMRVDYGIEQYFFERNARFETRIRFIKVKLSDSGGARIVELLDEQRNPVKIIYKNKTITS